MARIDPRLIEPGVDLPSAPESGANGLASFPAVIDSLDQVIQVVAVHGLVNSRPENGDQAAAIDGLADMQCRVGTRR